MAASSLSRTGRKLAKPGCKARVQNQGAEPGYRDRMQRQGAEDGAKNQVPDPAGAKVEVEVLLPDRAMLV